MRELDSSRIGKSTTSLKIIAIENLYNDLLLPWLDLYETAFPP